MLVFGVLFSLRNISYIKNKTTFLSYGLVLISMLIWLYSFYTPQYKIPETHLTSPVEGVLTKLKQTKKTNRLSIKTADNINILGIFYLPSKSICEPTKYLYQQPLKISQFLGRVEAIRQTKKQMQITIRTKKSKILAIFYQSKKRQKPYFVKVGNFVRVQSRKNKFFKRTDPYKRYYKAKWKKGLSHVGSIGSIEVVNFQTNWKPKPVNIKNCHLLAVPQFEIGQHLRLTPKKSFRKVEFLKYPYYLFAQNYRYYGYIRAPEILAKKEPLTLLQKIRLQLSDLYKKSPYQGFYESVLLAKKTLSKEIYRLFQKNDLIPFLVISGLHIDILISFFMGLLYFIFLTIHLLTKNSYKIFTPYRQFINLKYLSWVPFLLVSVVLIAYLNLISFPQSATRAVFCFIIAGGMHFLCLKTYRINTLFIAVFFLFLFFPYWIAYPLGSIYSITAVFSIYYTIPIITKWTSHYSFVRRYFAQLLLLGGFIHLFIVPIAIYNFHYYNLMAIFINIPVSMIFFIFLYCSAFASVLYFIVPTLSPYFLGTSDYLLSIILSILKFTSSFKHFVIYTKTPLSLTSVLVYYFLLILGLYFLKKKLRIKDLFV